MEHKEFIVGAKFKCNNYTWLCTDKGTRVIVAICISPEINEDPSWLNGPPYAVSEHVFDELDVQGCVQ